MNRKSVDRIFLVATVVIACAWRANADTLPSGATPISGSVAITLVGRDAIATLPFDVPDGQVFVLTDLEIARMTGSNTIQVFAADDPDTPRLQGEAQGSSASYQRTFQTGLVFSAAPTIKLPECIFSCGPTFTRVSFSGYFKGAP